jgi:OOP family OmpA-OmpF porin
MKSWSRTLVPQATALGLCLLLGTAAAQEKTVILKGKNVTADAFLDALTAAPPPAAAPAADEQPRTRSFKLDSGASSAPVGSAPVSAAVHAPRPAQSVGLLLTFQTNSAELSERSKQLLANIAPALKSDRLQGTTLVVEGHADPRGSAERNQELSKARAESTVQYLVSTYGIPAERFTPVGKGASALLKPDSPAAPENRRVTFRLGDTEAAAAKK